MGRPAGSGHDGRSRTGHVSAVGGNTRGDPRRQGDARRLRIRRRHSADRPRFLGAGDCARSNCRERDGLRRPDERPEARPRRA
jgi:hypothetical protein